MSQPGSRPGPFRADSVTYGAEYELSNGHPVPCAPSSGRCGGANLSVALLLATDPSVEEAGVHTGFSAEPGMLRAPDLAVGNVPAEPGWVKGVPPLAVEYAATGTDEVELRRKVSELLRAGTRWVWVVRLAGPRRVEVHVAGRAVEQVLPGGGVLTAPGVLRNPVRVEELYDREAALAANLRNLLQRRGFEGIEQLQAASEARGEARGELHSLLAVLSARQIAMTAEHEARIRACTDRAQIRVWIARAATARRVEEIFD